MPTDSLIWILSLYSFLVEWAAQFYNTVGGFQTVMFFKLEKVRSLISKYIGNGAVYEVDKRRNIISMRNRTRR